MTTQRKFISIEHDSEDLEIRCYPLPHKEFCIVFDIEDNIDKSYTNFIDFARNNEWERIIIYENIIGHQEIINNIFVDDALNTYDIICICKINNSAYWQVIRNIMQKIFASSITLLDTDIDNNINYIKPLLKEVHDIIIDNCQVENVQQFFDILRNLYRNLTFKDIIFTTKWMANLIVFLLSTKINSLTLIHNLTDEIYLRLIIAVLEKNKYLTRLDIEKSKYVTDDEIEKEISEYYDIFISEYSNEIAEDRIQERFISNCRQSFIDLFAVNKSITYIRPNINCIKNQLKQNQKLYHDMEHQYFMEPIYIKYFLDNSKIKITNDITEELVRFALFRRIDVYS